MDLENEWVCEKCLFHGKVVWCYREEDHQTCINRKLEELNNKNKNTKYVYKEKDIIL